MEFTKSEAAEIRYNSMRIVANETAECGPYSLEKTGKMFKVTHRDGTVKRFGDIRKAIGMIANERRTKFAEWQARYSTPVYYYGR